MVDTLVEATTHSDLDDIEGLWGPYWVDESIGVIVSVNSDNDAISYRTVDKGATWAETVIKAASIIHLACWYDKETPGDAGTLVHVIYMDTTGGGTVNYRTVDVSDGSLGTERVIDGTVTISPTDQLNRCAVTKALSGRLGAGFLDPTEIAFYTSDDAGATWDAKADVWELATENDFVLLFPANTGDNDDMCALYKDKSANELSIKMYDASLDAWTETAIASFIFVTSFRSDMDGAVRHSDNHVLITSHSNDDSATDDLRTWDLTVDSIAAPTVTAKTNIFTNQGESGQAAVMINQQNDDWYVAYLKGGTFFSSVQVVFHKSDDGGVTWEAEEAYSELSDDNRRVMGPRSVGDDGGRVMWSWYNHDLFDVYVNEVFDIEIPPAAAVVPGASSLLVKAFEGSIF